VKIVVPKERAPGEKRVALVPESVAKLLGSGLKVAVEAGAGEAAYHVDAAYVDVGAEVTGDAGALYAGANVVVRVRRPDANEEALVPDGAAVVALLQPFESADLVSRMDARGVRLLSLERVPRITRAQSMDVLSSQATVAGYQAVIIGAGMLPRFLPMLTTAAGAIAPGKAFVIGAGVAGLQAIATARRLGAVVSGFDIRPAAAEQVRSLGASFIAPEAVSEDAETRGGYARAQSEDEQERTLRAIAGHIVDQVLVITTALIPGRPAPRLITREMVESMQPGAVIVDLAAEAGGNCEASVPGETIDVNGVRIVAPLNLPSTLSTHASQMFSRNVMTLLQHLSREGELRIDPDDEVTGPMLLNPRAEEPAIAETGTTTPGP